MLRDKRDQASQQLLNKGLLNTNPYFISGTTEVTGLKGYMIKAIEDTVIATISCDVQGDSLAGETILAGDQWPMNVDSIKLTSGAIFVYRR